MQQPAHDNLLQQSDLIEPRLLPPVLRKLTKWLGMAAALDFVIRKGGGPYYIPTRVRQDSPILLDLGLEKASILVKEMPGTWLMLPKADKALVQLRHHAVRKLMQCNKSSAEIARELNYTTRRVQQIRMEIGAETNTQDLFGGKP